MSVRIPRQTESGFGDAVMQFARMCGWRTAHFRPGMNRRGQWQTAVQGDGKGFLDWLFVRERLVWAELKIPPNKLTAEQWQWKEALEFAGEEVYVWQPADWPWIERTLRGG